MAETYAHPEMLAETAWLGERLAHPGVRVIDCDARTEYDRAHVPDAVHLAQGRIKSKDDPLQPMTAEEFKALAESLGISNDTHVIAYDGQRGVQAAKLWWALGLYGHTNASVLNGGLKKWQREGRAVTALESVPRRGVFMPVERRDYLATAEDILERLNRKDTCVWDTRTLAEFTGQQTNNNKRPGHIPGAVNLDYVETIDPETGEVKPAAELRRMFAEKGITPDMEVITH